MANRKLCITDLEVESFETGPECCEPGTVHANEATAICPTNTCSDGGNGQTCYETCGASHPYQRECECMGDTGYATCGPCT